MQDNAASLTAVSRHQGELSQPLAQQCGPQLIQVGGRSPQPDHQAERDSLVLCEHAQLLEPLRIMAIQQTGTSLDRCPYCPCPLLRLAHIQPSPLITGKLIDCRGAANGQPLQQQAPCAEIAETSATCT